MRLIDAENFLEALENADADVCETYPDFYCDWGFSRKAIEDLLLNIPTIEAKPVVHGEWLERQIPLNWCDDDVDIIYLCSECEGSNWCETPYCPNCGADMRERNTLHEKLE